MTNVDHEWIVVSRFFVSGRPAPAGSKSVFRVKAKTGLMKNVVAPASKYSAAWMECVHYRCLEEFNGVIADRPVFLETEFRMSRPKSHYVGGERGGKIKDRFLNHQMISTPDTTKLVRCVEDAMTGVVWKDDSQVIEQRNRKRYVREGEVSGVLLIVSVLGEG